MSKQWNRLNYVFEYLLTVTPLPPNPTPTKHLWSRGQGYTGKATYYMSKYLKALNQANKLYKVLFFYICTYSWKTRFEFSILEIWEYWATARTVAQPMYSLLSASLSALGSIPLCQGLHTHVLTRTPQPVCPSSTHFSPIPQSHWQVCPGEDISGAEAQAAPGSRNFGV